MPTQTASDFRVGQRVELEPHLDLWMRGARFGTVAIVRKTSVTIKLDLVKPLKRFTADQLRHAR